MVGVSICIGLPWYSCYDVIVMGEARKFQIGSGAEVCIWVPNRSTGSSNATTWCQLM